MYENEYNHEYNAVTWLAFNAVDQNIYLPGTPGRGGTWMDWK